MSPRLFSGGALARWGVLAAVVVAGVTVDQVTKYLANVHVRGRGIITVVEGFFELRYVRNPGAFFSMGADLDPDVRRVTFVLASVAASVLIVRLYARATDEQRLLRGGLMLLLAGALGNLVDRALEGAVTDFVHLRWRDAIDWATFNVADVLITAGLVLLALDLLWPRKALESSPAEANPEASP